MKQRVRRRGIARIVTAAACALGIAFAGCASNRAQPATRPATAITAAATSDGPVRLLLPPVIYATTGIECNVYFDNVVLVADRRDYAFDAICDRGLQLDERWAFTPTVKDVGDHPIEIDVRDESNAVLARAKSVVRVTRGPSTQPASTRRAERFTLLIVGDSLTERANYPRHVDELGERDPELNLKLIGCRGPGNAPATGPVRFEGYSGWTAQAFVTFHGPLSRSGQFKRPDTGSPFVYDDDGSPPRLDFARYCKQFNDGRPPDAITIFLGTNDVFSATDATIDTVAQKVLGYYDKLIAAFHAFGGDTPIGIIITTPPTRSQDGFRNYIGAGRQTRWQYRRNQHRLIELMTRRYAGREGEHIYLVPAYLNLDTERDFPTWTAKANARATTQLTRVLDGAHPSDEGYFQIADSIYCWLKAISASGQ